MVLTTSMVRSTCNFDNGFPSKRSYCSRAWLGFIGKLHWAVFSIILQAHPRLCEASYQSKSHFSEVCAYVSVHLCKCVKIMHPSVSVCDYKCMTILSRVVTGADCVMQNQRGFLQNSSDLMLGPHSSLECLTNSVLSIRRLWNILQLHQICGILL